MIIVKGVGITQIPIYIYSRGDDMAAYLVEDRR